MGSEILKIISKSYKKGIDKSRARLATADLFTQAPVNQPRSAVACITDKSSLKSGEKVIIEPRGKELVASRGNSVVALFKNPPADIMTAITQSGGIAKGEIQKINNLSKTADITIC